MWAAQSRGKGFKSPEAEANRRKVAEYLLDAGADVNLPADVIMLSLHNKSVCYYDLFTEWVDTSDASQSRWLH